MSKPETMMIDDVKYVREDSVKSSNSDELNGLKYAIVRSRVQGVMAGYIESVQGQAVVLKRARQLWRWHSKFVLADLAEFGCQDTSKCKFSDELSQDTIMLEACAVMYCTEVAGKSIRGIEAQKND